MNELAKKKDINENDNTGVETENPVTGEGKDKDMIITLKQDELDAMVEHRLARQKRALTAQFEERIAKLKSETESAEGVDEVDSEELDQERKRAESLAQEKTRLEEELAEMRYARLESLKKESLRSVARDLGAISPEDVYHLVEKNIHCTEDGRTFPVTSDGTQILGENSSPLSVEAYVARFLNERPYLLKSSTEKQGAGSGVNGGGADPRQSFRKNEYGSRTQNVLKKGFYRDRQLEQQGRFWHGGPDLG